MVVPYFEVLAFTKSYVGGNPAGICILEQDWPSDAQMQQIAWQNNIAETAFIIERRKGFDLRWFTPAVEVDLCGHATLATAHVLFTHFGRNEPNLRFQTQAGELKVEQAGDRLVLDFPARSLRETVAPKDLAKALGAEPTSVWHCRDYYAVFDRQDQIAGLQPDLEALCQIDTEGVVVTAPGRDCDFVSRYFAPKIGIPEDPVTGSNHCCLIPFWSERLGKKELYARQLSSRSGELFCENRGERVGIGGTCLTYVEGKLHFD